MQKETKDAIIKAEKMLKQARDYAEKGEIYLSDWVYSEAEELLESTPDYKKNNKTSEYGN